jgi:hypothetical protein
MTTTTLDAAIDAAGGAIANGRNIVRPVKVTKAQRTYARALIARLIEGMDVFPYPMNGFEAGGYMTAIQEMRRRAGLEVKS